HHFRRFAPEQIPYAIKRYTDETARLYGVMDKRLGEAAYLAGPDYTIADIASYPWIARHEWQGQDLADFPNLKRWYDAISARPAVECGFKVPCALMACTLAPRSAACRMRSPPPARTRRWSR